MDIAKTVSLNIKERLVRLEMTQGQLAGKVGMTPTALSARMRGVREFRLSELEAVAEALHATLPDLVPNAEVEGVSR